MDLQVSVNDQVVVFDSLPQVLEYVEEVIRKWYASDEQTKLTIVIEKLNNKAPPALSISTTEITSTGESLV